MNIDVLCLWSVAHLTITVLCFPLPCFLDTPASALEGRLLRHSLDIHLEPSGCALLLPNPASDSESAEGKLEMP